MSHWKQQITQVGEKLEQRLQQIDCGSLDLQESNRELELIEAQFLAKKGLNQSAHAPAGKHQRR